MVGETLEELATKRAWTPPLSRPPWTTFNADVDAGVDEEFGRTLFNCKLENGPWVATPAPPACTTPWAA